MQCSKIFNAISILVVLVLSAVILSNIMYATPYGPEELKNFSTSIKDTYYAAKTRADNRSTITVVRLNVTKQTLNWKAYVGNITSKLTLDDANSYTIYDWGDASLDGEVYATRKTTTVTWASLVCANYTRIETEQTALSHSATADDSINNTFNGTAHVGFSVGTSTFPADACNHTRQLYKNDARQASDWTEIALHDGTNVVYAAIINETTQGYNQQYYDFQMIVAENGTTSVSPAAITYYFYVELS